MVPRQGSHRVQLTKTQERVCLTQGRQATDKRLTSHMVLQARRIQDITKGLGVGDHHQAEHLVATPIIRE